MCACASLRLDCRFTQSTVQKRSSRDQRLPVADPLRERGLDDQRLVVVDLVDAVVVRLLRQPAHLVDLRRTQERVHAVVLAVVAHQLHVEADHALDPGREVGEAARDLLGRHVGAAVVERARSRPGRRPRCSSRTSICRIRSRRVLGSSSHQSPSWPAGRSALRIDAEVAVVAEGRRSSRSWVSGAGPPRPCRPGSSCRSSAG